LLERGKGALNQGVVVHYTGNTLSKEAHVGQSVLSAADRLRSHCSVCWNPKAPDLRVHPSWSAHTFPVEKVVVDPGWWNWSKTDKNTITRLYQNRARTLERTGLGG